MHWTSGGKRNRGRPKGTINGARDENTQMELGPSHKVDRKLWHTLVVDLCVISQEKS